MDNVPFLDVDAIEIDETPACEFKLGGRTWQCRSTDQIPAPLLLQIANAGTEGITGRLGDIFAMVLQPAQIADFNALLADPASNLTLGRITPLLEYIVEQVVKRPTQPASASPAGPTSITPRSEVAYSSAAIPSIPYA